MGLTRERWCCAGIKLSRLDMDTSKTSIKTDILIIVLLKPASWYYKQYETITMVRLSN